MYYDIIVHIKRKRDKMNSAILRVSDPDIILIRNTNTKTLREMLVIHKNVNLNGPVMVRPVIMNNQNNRDFTCHSKELQEITWENFTIYRESYIIELGYNEMVVTTDKEAAQRILSLILEAL